MVIELSHIHLSLQTFLGFPALKWSVLWSECWDLSEVSCKVSFMGMLSESGLLVTEGDSLHVNSKGFLDASVVGGRGSNLSRFVWDFPDFSTESPPSWNPPSPSRANQESGPPPSTDRTKPLLALKEGQKLRLRDETLITQTLLLAWGRKAVKSPCAKKWQLPGPGLRNDWTSLTGFLLSALREGRAPWVKLSLSLTAGEPWPHSWALVS